MAKKKVHPRPGALKELLKKRGMNQMEAADPEVGTGVDRKTLAKINRGEGVKLETLEMVATRLRVPVGYFLGTTEADDEINDPSAQTVMLRRLNGERLAELLKGDDKVDWLLNVQVIDGKARKLLDELESAVRRFRVIPGYTDSLSDQLQRLKSFDRLSGILKELHECRLAVLGGDYLSWERSYGPYIRDPKKVFVFDYTSRRKVLLSVEPSSTQSRRVPVSQGPEPPKFAPNASTIVRVDGRRLDTADPPISNFDFDFRRTHANREK
jgi:transcriptional regulator with XRE-family HTH domain